MGMCVALANAQELLLVMAQPTNVLLWAAHVHIALVTRVTLLSAQETESVRVAHLLIVQYVMLVLIVEIQLLVILLTPVRKILLCLIVASMMALAALVIAASAMARDPA